MVDKKYVIFGDVHGEAILLQRLIDQAKEKYSNVEFYSLGDLVDRGPNSKGVLDICIKENVHGILGNHDQCLYEFVVNNIFEEFYLNASMGGKATVESFGVNSRSSTKEIAQDFHKALTQEYRSYIKSLKSYRRLEIGGKIYWLIHAGLTNSVAEHIKDFKTISNEKMMKEVGKNYLNSILWPSPDLSEKDNLFHFDNGIQLFGHRPVQSPLVKEHFVALDTGCGTCAPFALSAIVLPDFEFVSVQEEWV